MSILTNLCVACALHVGRPVQYPGNDDITTFQRGVGKVSLRVGENTSLIHSSSLSLQKETKSPLSNQCAGQSVCTEEVLVTEDLRNLGLKRANLPQWRRLPRQF